MTDPLKTAFDPSNHTHSWLKGLPRRWARNGFLLGAVISTTALLPRLTSDGAAAWGLIVSYALAAGLLAIVGALMGVGARYLLREPFLHSPQNGVESIVRKYVIGSFAVGGAILLADIVFQWRRSHRFGQPGNTAEDIGYLVGFFGAIALIAFLIGLVSKWGVRKAIKLDGQPPKQVRREPTVTFGAVSDAGNAHALAAAEPTVDWHAANLSEPPQASEIQAGRHNNLIARHWRGELSLPWSYWGVAVVGNVLAAGAIIAVAALFSTDKGYDPGPIFWLLASVWGIVFVVLIWQVVGTWRSATNYAVQRRRANQGTGWATAAKIMIVLGVIRTVTDFSQAGALQLAETYKMAFRGDPNMPAYSLRVMRNGTEIEVSGGFKFGLTADFERVFGASPQIRVVHLTSVGGRIGEAEKLGRLIRERGLSTYVPNHCQSACTLAFASGRERWIGQNGKLGFHGPAFPGVSGSELAEMSRGWKAQYAAAGISSGFIDKALAVPNADMWYPTTQELFSANIVTKVANGSQFASSGYKVGISEDEMAALLARNSAAIAEIKMRMPADFLNISRNYFQNYLIGKSDDELNFALRKEVGSIIKASKILADDQVLIDFAKVAVEQYRTLRKTPELCYLYASGTSNVNPSKEFSTDLLQRELALSVAAIRTARPRQQVAQNAINNIYERLYSSLLKRFGVDKMSIFQLTTVPANQHGDYCDIAIAMYQEILEMPSLDAARILRSIEAS